MSRRTAGSGILISGILACIVMGAIALYADVPRLFAALAHFPWQLLPLILGLTFFNYLGRFARWQYYLKCLKVRIHWRKSFLIFLSGLSMALTPGKVGEFLKSYLLKSSTGVAVSRTSPVIVAERLTDCIAMIGLAAAGLVLYRYGWEFLLVLLVCGLLGILLIQNRSIALPLLSFGERLPIVSHVSHLVRVFYESSYTLLQWRPLLLAILIGIVSWSGECAALYFVFVGLGIEAGGALFIKATFILAVSTLIGSASGLPGGLGSADGSMLGLSRLLITTSSTIAGAATLLIRLCTLWFGTALGVIALLIFRLSRTADLVEPGEDGLEERQKHDAGPAQTVDEQLSPLPKGEYS